MKFRSAFTVILLLLSLTTLGQPKPGTVFPQGQPGVDYNVKDTKGKKTGIWVRTWKSTGNLIYRGQFRAGVPAGKWEMYYEDGTLSGIKDHIQDTTIVDATFYHLDGKTVMSQGRYVKKKKEGNWKVWDESGTLRSDETYKDSLLEGVCKYYYSNNKILKIENYKAGMRDGAFTEYFENGKKRSEGNCIADSFDGPYKSWFETGVTDCEGRYVKGMNDGDWVFYNEDGTVKAIILYKKGREVKRKYENGTFKEEYDSGIPKSEYTYENGKKDGPFMEWYDKGKLVRVDVEDPELKNLGYQKEELQDTQLRIKGTYLNDQMEGEVVYYKENGSIEKVEEWTDGKLIRTRQLMK